MPELKKSKYLWLGNADKLSEPHRENLMRL
ncbi:hypothetical protein [Effusibacillus consociatus]|uniref:Transposase n=1 Tax=Effusibacillus consociatus TaxID=1117041 RepID=A0ABV9Q730_9BACL